MFKGKHMGKSRVESFKEYRENMIGDEEVQEKTQIETELKTTSSEASASLTPQETALLKMLKNRKGFWTWTFIITVSILTLAVLIFGFILFRS